MEGSRDLAIQKLKEYRLKYQGAKDATTKYQAADGFKSALIGLTVALKTEENESIRLV